MEFEVTNGAGDISIGYWNSGECLKIRKTVSLVLEEPQPSIELGYLSTYKTDYDISSLIDECLKENYNEDFTDNEAHLFKTLSPLCKQLKNGKYRINYFKDLRTASLKYYSKKWNLAKNLHIFISNTLIDKANYEQLRTEYNKYVESKLKTKEFIADFIDYTSVSFICDQLQIIATKTSIEINAEKVALFEEEIKKGKRPFALLFCNEYHENITLSNGELYDDKFCGYFFILDGHHKLQAYKNLNIYPPVAVIVTEDNPLYACNLNFSDIINDLIPEHLEHFLTNWFDKEKHLVEYFKKRGNESTLKDGTYSLYYNNGKKFYEATFASEVLDGDEKAWYDSGTQLFFNIYNKGRSIGKWKSWYKEGQIKTVKDYDNNDNGITTTYYFENGKKRRNDYVIKETESNILLEKLTGEGRYSDLFYGIIGIAISLILVLLLWFFLLPPLPKKP